MKKRILLFTAILAIGYLSFSSYIEGPASQGYDCTGAETNNGQGNPTGCSATGVSCHSSSATAAITLSLTLDSAGQAVTHYVGGHIYTVTITGTNTTANNLPKFGFQVTCIKGSIQPATAVSAGTFSNIPASTHITATHNPYVTINIVEHSIQLSPTSGTGGTGTIYSRSITWTAPATGTGAVSFWGAMNAVNNNGTNDNGDLWNTTSLIVNEEAANTAGVATLGNNIKVAVYPNPVSNSLQVKLNDAGNYSIKIFDINGRQVAAENATGSTPVSINTASWAAGMYAVQVEKDGVMKVMPVIKK